LERKRVRGLLRGVYLITFQVHPVRKDGALTPPFLLGIEVLFYIILAINGGVF
jgi:hypothetical protein